MEMHEFEPTVAKALTRRRIEQADRRLAFGTSTHKERDAEVAAAWADLEAAHPAIPREEVKPEPKAWERQQIEKIGYWIWDMFHARHGGEFDPSATDTPAVKMTMLAADRAWAIAQQKGSQGTDAVGVIFTHLNKMAHAEDWMWIDLLLTGLDVTRLSDDEVAAYARTAWPMREHLESYGEFLDLCRAAIRRRGGDLGLLQGLEAAVSKSS